MKQKKDDVKVKMISALTEALNYRKKNPKADEEAIMKQVARFVSKEKNEDSKIAMIAAASRGIKMLERKEMLDRQVIKQVMAELPEIINKIE